VVTTDDSDDDEDGRQVSRSLRDGVIDGRGGRARRLGAAWVAATTRSAGVSNPRRSCVAHTSPLVCGLLAESRRSSVAVWGSRFEHTF